VSWQDPSADIANVNAAYRVERDENRRLREALTAIRDGDYCSGARNIASAALGENEPPPAYRPEVDAEVDAILDASEREQKP
jgi:hypothetical protein